MYPTIVSTDAAGIVDVLIEAQSEVAKPARLCPQILFKALNEGGHLIIGERVVAEIGDTSSDTIDTKYFDVYMMVRKCGCAVKSKLHQRF